MLAASATVSFWNLTRLPDASPLPLVLGLVAFAVGKYLLCPLRWHALSVSGRGRWWHIRAYAESELLGLLSPASTGADLWRIHRLHKAGMGRAAAVAEAALDRFVGMVAIALGIALAGVALPPRILVAFVGVGAAVLAGALLVRRRRPDLFARRPLPSPRVFATGLAFSLGYQATIAGLIFAAVLAVGQIADPLALLGVFAASQLASLIPGVNGANPRSGALAVGLTSLGVSWTEALGAVALVAVLPWAPALLFGGTSFAARHIERRLAARTGADRAVAGGHAGRGVRPARRWLWRPAQVCRSEPARTRQRAGMTARRRGYCLPHGGSHPR